MTPRLFYEGTLATGTGVTLGATASHHLVKVLRARQGDEVVVFNGDGKQYRAVVEQADQRSCSLQLTAEETCNNESPVHITLLQGLSRHDRMDTTLQKATELGVNAIVPVTCRHSQFRLDAERREKKLAHWRQVIISACEQSGRCSIPELQPPMDFTSAIASQKAADSMIMLDPTSEAPISETPSLDERVVLLVGPESGLDASETEQARQQGFFAARLGPRVLRTETAAPAAITAIQVLWGDFNE